MKIVVGADKGGFSLKEAIVAHLKETATAEILDVGLTSLGETLVSFIDIAENAAMKVSSGEYDRGILICGTGMGMSLAANKIKGARAAVVESLYTADYCRRINDANILCLGGFVIGPQLGCEITDKFLNTAFTQAFPQWRIDFVSSQKVRLRELEERHLR